ncbi:MAG: DUF6719 family protein [Burkholderiaceae bacterium]
MISSQVFVLGMVAFIAAQAAQPILKVPPKEGEIPHGKVVFVDDGTCPKGEVREVTGGNRAKSIPRKSRCVKRPAKSD